MSVKMIELEEVLMIEASDDALEYTVTGFGVGPTQNSSCLAQGPQSVLC